MYLFLQTKTQNLNCLLAVTFRHTSLLWNCLSVKQHVLYCNKQYLSMCMIWLMASKRTAFLAFECWTFFDLGGSYNRSTDQEFSVISYPISQAINTNVALNTWALFRMVSRHSFNLPWMAGSSIVTKESTLNDLLIFSTLVFLLQCTTDNSASAN